MVGDVFPWEDRILVPGRGIEGDSFFSVPGRDRWRVYWFEDGRDAW
jgi:hypothetical protein